MENLPAIIMDAERRTTHENMNPTTVVKSSRYSPSLSCGILVPFAIAEGSLGVGEAIELALAALKARLR